MLDHMTRQTEAETYTMPVVVRARGYYLYDRGGKRYIDFFQNHGRAILGHRPEGVQRALKSTISRGLVAEYPSIYQGRLEKILAQLLPDFPYVRIYPQPGSLGEFLRRTFGTDTVFDPAVGTSPDGCKASYWRPFLGDGGADTVLLFPILPFPGSFIPEIVCVSDESLARKLPPAQPSSPLLLDLLIKSVSALLRLYQSEEAVVARATDNPLKGLFGEPRGPYLLTGLSEEPYRELYHEALAAGVVLPPGPEIPMIFPVDYHDGDIAEFRRIAARYC